MKFSEECKQVAAVLKAANPSGVNPIREPVRHCRDCGRVTTADYLCTKCAHDLRQARAGAA